MSKKKRVRRDIEKFYRAGRYWELIRLLEGEDLVSAHSKEHQEAWKAVIKRALVDERSFQQFGPEAATLKVLPSSPDFRLLMGLSRAIEDVEPPEDLFKLNGLSSEAERLRSRFASFVSSRFQREKLKGVLTKFIREPEKITRRYFEDVADLIPARSIAATVRDMGACIPLARRFNSKAAVAAGWDGVHLSKLAHLDTGVKQICFALPDSMVDILLHPFLQNLAVMCRRLAPEATFNRASELVGVMPFLLRRLAGQKFEEVESKLLMSRGEWVGEGHEDFGGFVKKVELLSLEEKVALLNTFGRRARDILSEDSDFDDEDFFDDEEDDAFPDEEASEIHLMALSLLALHTSVLTDIKARYPKLTPREKKELTRVMEPVLIRDFDVILDALEDLEVLVDFLLTAIEAGCAGTRLTLLAVLAGARYHRGDLRRRAEKYLDQLPAVTREDLKWICHEWGELFYPKVQTLKPLLVRFQDQGLLLDVFVNHLCKSVEFNLIEYMLKTEFSRLPLALRSLFPTRKPEEPEILRRELAAFTEHRVLDPVRLLLGCYADGLLTTDAHLCWLKAYHSLKGEDVWDFALQEIRRYREADERGRIVAGMRSMRTLQSDKIDATLLFMQEHLDDLSRLSTDVAGPLLEELLRRPEMPVSHHPLLIRLEKVMAQRVEAGEEAARSMRDEIRRVLKELAKAEAQKPPKSRKRKR
ncbi:MAG: hypothetical protein AB9873_02160 [Syntrophobacteraceae bacterium]